MTNGNFERVCVIEPSFYMLSIQIKLVSYLNEITTNSLLAFSLQFTLSKSTLVLFLNNVLSTYTFFRSPVSSVSSWLLCNKNNKKTERVHHQQENWSTNIFHFYWVESSFSQQGIWFVKVCFSPRGLGEARTSVFQGYIYKKSTEFIKHGNDYLCVVGLHLNKWLWWC